MHTPIFAGGRRMNVAIFSTKGPGNFYTAIELASRLPDTLAVKILVSDNLNNPSIELAKQYKIHTIAKNFDIYCGRYKEIKSDRRLLRNYETKSEELHNIILEEILEYEASSGEKIDLLVLAYRRILKGNILSVYADRIINQHPADLSIIHQRERVYKGIGGLKASILDHQKYTRTSTILVNSDVDQGEIICQGPKIKVTYPIKNKTHLDLHENKQKIVSDRPALQFSLEQIAKGNLAISKNLHAGTNSRVIIYKKRELPYGGYSLE